MPPVASTPAQPPQRRRSLRWHLVALVLAALIPAVAVAGLAVWRAASAYRDASRARLLDTARTLARAVESELDCNAAVLQTLAASSGGRNGDVPGWVERVGTQLQGRILTLDARERTVDGAVLGKLAQSAAQRGGATVSNLYEEPGDVRPRVALAVARPASVSPASVLALETTPQQLVRALQQGTASGPGLLVAVTDGAGRIVARSLDADRFVGTMVPDWARLQAIGAASGLFPARTIEGRQVMFAFESLRGTPGWVLVAGEPLEAYAARWQQPLMGVAAGGLLALVLAAAGASWLGRLVLRPVQALGRRARLIGADRGQAAPAPVEPSAIEEFEALRTSLAEAEDALRERAEAERSAAQALAERERRHRTLVEAGALTLWRCDSQGAMTAADGWQDLTGQTPGQWRRFGWIDRVHMDDRERMSQAWRDAVAARRLVDVEFRIHTTDGSARWVRTRGAPVLDDGGDLIEWVGTMEDVDDRHRVQERIAYMAHHDALTGLPNRARFRESLEAAISRAGRGQAGALLCIDLDRFKDVNDSLGHPVGDALLVAATQRLSALVRATDTVARLGGDEFAVVAAETHGPTDASILAGRIIEALAVPYELEGQHIVCGASVGVMLVTGVQSDADALLRKADMALYRAKENGRGQFCFFEPEMDARLRARRAMEQELRRALDAGELEVHYQPLVRPDTRQVSGFEALVRWRHPRRGLVMPDDFIALAEDIGLIVPIGEWVLAQACHAAAAWPQPLVVAVNVSAVQLIRGDLVTRVGAALRASALAPQRLELEVSERSMLAEGDAGLEALRLVKTLGVQLAMDDFGTGHSSLGSLSSVPFDRVKIDRSFVAGLGVRREAEAIVAAVTRLCDGLGLATTAEGVETESQLAFLLQERCTDVQGLLFGGAMPADEVAGYLVRWGIASQGRQA